MTGTEEPQDPQTLSEPQQPTMMLGKVNISTPRTRTMKLGMLLWGSAGCGKTTLAATAPGKKLLINFDPNGPASLGNASDDILIADFSGQSASIVEEFEKDDPLRLSKFIEENEIGTIIVDSVTTFGDLALQHGVARVRSPNATMLTPTMRGYGYRNAFVMQMLRKMLRLAQKCDVHLIIVAHEDVPEKTEEGIVLHISIMLGGKMPEQAPVNISEVWNVRDDGKKRFIAIRPCRQRKPMKTRMFQTTTGPEFEWRFNADTWEGDGRIDKWYNKWVEQEGKKIPIPK